MITGSIERQINKQGLEIMNKFMIRNSYMDKNYFFEKLSNEELSKMSQNEQLIYLKNLVLCDKKIKETIAISSPSLLSSIESISTDSKSKDKRNVIKGIFRYLNRVSTRTTPFGLCASVGIGEFLQNSTEREISFNYQKRVQIDMEWAHKLIKLLQADYGLLNQLDVKLNQGILIKGNRAKLVFSSDSVDYEGSNSTYSETTINYNHIVEEVYSLSKKGIPFREVIAILSLKYPLVETKVITQFLVSLVEQEFLVTNLNIPNNVHNPLAHILDVLLTTNEKHPIVNELKIINEMINFYQELPIGEGLDIYMNTIEKMKNIVSVKNFLKVDLITNEISYLLTESHKKEIENITKLLCDFTAINGGVVDASLQEYHSSFLERYGLDREVPILELLDKDFGLGAPNGYKYPPNEEENGDFKGRHLLGFVDNLFLEWIMESLLTNQYELQLSEEHIDMISKVKESENRLPDSLDIYFTTHRHNGEKKFILGSNPYANGAGSTLGRFINYFPDQYDFWIDINKREKKLHPDALLVEVQPAPVNPRNLNVCQVKDRRDYNMCIISNTHIENNINIDDVVVGCTHDALYIKSQELQKEIIPLTSHMLNPDICPNVYRFLLEVGAQRRGTNYPYFFSNLVSLDLAFIPRISYKNFILSPARWTIKHHTFKGCKNLEDFIDAFNVFREKYSLPKYVYLSVFDNRILLNTENTMHIQDLFKEVSKLSHGLTLALIEYVESDEKYPTELVFSLINTKISSDEEVFTKKVLNNNMRVILDKNRMKMPFSEWIYIKLYCPENRQEELLGEHLLKFIHKNDWFEQFFYMRYKDPKFHIRLRFKVPLVDKEKLDKVKEWINQLQEIGIISNCIIDTYDPEIERYGGPELINYAENLFYYDSLLSLELINRKQNQTLSISKDHLSIINISNYMHSFGLDYQEQLAFLSKTLDYKKYLKEFRENKNSLVNIFEKYNNTLARNKYLEEHPVLYDLFQLRNEMLAIYLKEVNRYEKDGSLYSNKDHILDSIIHLHLNRLIGIDREFEEKALSLYRHILYTWINQAAMLKGEN
ncbi:lantibiotic dehydratase [Metasolibacillus meyeri]|uniref:lantibiotic dehydratase n=1 Tax=Metasolibacillus meyeri TaxID=1071052 RepID=UPI00187D4369|nr:lantibiotic dehydratase [Metasolibacillus meyeri]